MILPKRLLKRLSPRNVRADDEGYELMTASLDAVVALFARAAHPAASGGQAGESIRAMMK